MTGKSPRALLVGLGTLHGGDDRVGLDVAAGVADLGLEGVEVVEHADPTELVQLWEGHDHVVVVDALLAGADPGTVLVVEAGAGSPPLHNARLWTSGGGTHAFGLADAVALARALDRLPRRLTLVGIVAETFHPMSTVSDVVRAAVPGAIDRAARALRPGPGVKEESYDVPG